MSNDLFNIIKLGNFYKGGSCLAMNTISKYVLR